MMIVLRNRRSRQHISHEAAVCQPADHRHVPDRPGPAPVRAAGLSLPHGELRQIIADRVFPAKEPFQLRPGDGEPGYHAHTGQLHQRGSASEYHPRRGHILHQVKFPVIRPPVRVSSQPDQHDPVPDLRPKKHCGGHICDRSQSRHIQRLLRRILHGESGQMLRRRRDHRLHLTGQIRTGPPENPLPHLFPSHQSKNPVDLLKALFHTVLRPV